MHYLELDFLSYTACNPVVIVWQYAIRNVVERHTKVNTSI